LVFAAAILFNEDLVFTLAKAFEIASRGVVNEFVAGAFGATGEKVRDVEAIDFIFFREGSFSEGCDGRKKIDCAAEFVAQWYQLECGRVPTSHKEHVVRLQR
jgi:hypothetical protein